MAGDWIKMERATPDKPEVWEISDALDMDPDAVVGKLFRVWCWFDQHTECGHAPSVTKRLLDRAVGVTGFCQAVIDAGWMEDDGVSLILPNFDRHNGKTAKNRALALERKKKQRYNVTDTSRSNRDASVTREEKRREEKNKENPLGTSQGDAPKDGPDDYTPEFEQLWQARPRREGQDNKRKAFKAYRARIREGHTHDEMLTGVKAYKRHLEADGKVGTKFVQMTSTFLGPDKHFRDDWSVAKGKPQSNMPESARWAQ
jgi:hypothetical protein